MLYLSGKNCDLILKKPVMEKRNSDLKMIEDMAQKLQNDSKQFAVQARNIKRVEKHCSPYNTEIAQSNKTSFLSKCKNLHSALNAKIVKLNSKNKFKDWISRRIQINKSCEITKGLSYSRFRRIT